MWVAIKCFILNEPQYKLSHGSSQVRGDAKTVAQPAMLAITSFLGYWKPSIVLYSSEAHNLLWFIELGSCLSSKGAMFTFIWVWLVEYSSLLWLTKDLVIIQEQYFMMLQIAAREGKKIS